MNTKYGVFIAEDEPRILRSIVNKINSVSSDFQILGTSFNGRDALREIKRLKPHILITDICMPIMDGLDLIEEVNKHFPEIISVIISGYQEFEYAKKAINLRVEDYLLKPLSVTQLSNLLIKLKGRLDGLLYNKEYEIFNSIINFNAPINVIADFDFTNLEVFYFCINFPITFTPKSREFIENIDCIYEKMTLKRLIEQYSSSIESYWIINSSFHNEKYIILSKNDEAAPISLNIFNDICKNIEGIKCYIAASNIILDSFESLHTKTSELREITRSNAVLEKCVFISFPTTRAAQLDMLVSYSELEKKIISFCENNQKKSLLLEINRIFDSWQEKGIPVRVLEINIKQIMRTCINSVNFICEFDIKYYEEQIEILFLNSTTYTEILLNTTNMIISVFNGVSDSIRYDHSKIVQSVVKYIDEKYTEKISFQSLAESFGISDSLLSKLFKKEIGESPITYAIKLRIEKAKKLLKEYPDMMQKDIAYLTGFGDQYYFSRVFKSITEMTPTEYRLNLN